MRQVPELTQLKLDAASRLHSLGQLAQAQAIYEDVLIRYPEHVDCLHMLGVIAAQQSRCVEAVTLIGRAIAVDPGNTAIYCNRGICFFKLGQYAAAIADYDKAISIDPCCSDAYTYRGVALHELGQLDAALASHDIAIANNSQHVAAYSNRGNTLRRMKLLEAAIVSYDRAIVIRPEFSEAHFNRGIALREISQPEAALRSFDRAIVLNPEYAEAYVQKATTLLAMGDFKSGWELYEWRWKKATISSSARHGSQTLWLGHEPLNGKRILLHSEQGYGDTIQFCRYAALVAAKGAYVILEAPRALVPLLKHLPGVSEVVAVGSLPPPFDHHCPLLSLPLALRTTLSTIPSSAGYLCSDDDLLAKWTARLPAKTQARVGLVWRGSAAHVNDCNRSIGLSTLLAQLPLTCDYFGLQKELVAEDYALPPHTASITHLGSAIRDFADTAALCQLMDLVITVDTSVAHLAGAMGKLTWILLPYNSDWRWLLNRADSLWYSSVRLYRQAIDQNWPSVLKKVRDDLATFGDKVCS